MSRFSFRFAVPVLSMAVLLLSCGHPAKTAAATTKAAPVDPFADSVPNSRDADDAARFLAGMPGNPGSPFIDLEKKEAWKVHRRELDLAWGGMESKTIASMREFQTRELGEPAIESAPVFYPFSGPDALMLTVFFPRNPVYVMVALEPPGTLPAIKHFTGKNLEHELTGTRFAIYSELHRSFFITREMDRQFRGQVTDGLMPMIVHLLVRTGHTILGYRYVRLDEAGKIIDRAAPSPATGNKGVEVEFRSDADQSVHKLYYFSTNLSDQRIQQNQPFLAFLASLNGVASYFKATSYMTHKPEFSTIRDQVLARSAAILQDDSGIPYRYFRSQPWQVQLYGDYIRPYGSFRWLEQPDLKKAYSAPGPKPLNFKIGYGYSRAPSNLLLARRGTAGQ